jgi:flagellar motor switch protein FliM
MRRVLTQEEIDALFSAAQPGQQAGSTRRKKNVEKCDLSKSKTLAEAEDGMRISVPAGAVRSHSPAQKGRP